MHKTSPNSGSMNSATASSPPKDFLRHAAEFVFQFLNFPHAFACMTGWLNVQDDIVAFHNPKMVQRFFLVISLNIDQFFGSKIEER